MHHHTDSRCMCRCMHVCVCLHACVGACMCVCLHVHACVGVCVHTYVCVPKYESQNEDLMIVFICCFIRK